MEKKVSIKPTMSVLLSIVYVMHSVAIFASPNNVNATANSVKIKMSPSAPETVDVNITDHINYQALNKFISAQDDRKAKFFAVDNEVLILSKKPIVLPSHPSKSLTDFGLRLTLNSLPLGPMIEKIPHFQLVDNTALQLLPIPEDIVVNNPSALQQKPANISQTTKLISTTNSQQGIKPNPIVATRRWSSGIIAWYWGGIAGFSVFVLGCGLLLARRSKSNKKASNSIETTSEILEKVYELPKQERQEVAIRRETSREKSFEKDTV